MGLLNVSVLFFFGLALTGVASRHQVFGKEKHVTPGEGLLKAPNITDPDYRRCPRFWHRLGSRCFTFVSEKRDWTESQLHCIHLGGTLASVHNMRENRFLQRLTEGSTGVMTEAWLGGTDATKLRTWIWIDSTRFDFSFWAPGEPNNPGRQDCLQMNYGDHKKWDDLSCYEKRASICARPLRA